MKPAARILITLTLSCFFPALAAAQQGDHVSAADRQLLPPDSITVAASQPSLDHNLLPNPGLEEPNATGDSPKHWQQVDNLVWHWTSDPDAPEHGKVIKIDTTPLESQAYEWWTAHFIKGTPLDQAPMKKPYSGPGYDTIGGNDGGFYWSDMIPIKPGRGYKVYVDAKGPISKVFVRGYEKELPLSFGDEEPATQEVFRNARGEPKNDANGRLIRYRLRYRYTMWFRAGGSEQWKTYTNPMPAHPTSREMTRNVRFIRIMLYPYWPLGTYWYDNIRVYEVDPDTAQANPSATEADYVESKVLRPAGPTTAPAK